MTTVRVLTQRAARAAYWTVEQVLLLLWTLLVCAFGIIVGLMLAVMGKCY